MSNGVLLWIIFLLEQPVFLILTPLTIKTGEDSFGEILQPEY